MRHAAFLTSYNERIVVAVAATGYRRVKQRQLEVSVAVGLYERMEGLVCGKAMSCWMAQSVHGGRQANEIFDALYGDPAECSIFRVQPRSGPPDP